jgi:hypothetical protein
MKPIDAFLNQRIATWLILIICIVCSAAIWSQMGVGKSGLVGNGKLVDHGYLSYPRYRIIFDRIDTDASPSNSFLVGNFPMSQLTFGLEIIDEKTSQPLESVVRDLKRTEIELHVRIKHGDSVVAEACAPLREWELAESTVRRMLWHPRLRDMRLKKALSYHIIVEFKKPPTVKNGRLVLQPLLEGGGFELP